MQFTEQNRTESVYLSIKTPIKSSIINTNNNIKNNDSDDYDKENNKIEIKKK